jgi:hypothetical protein
MHPYLTQAVAAERVADFQRAAAAQRRGRLANSAAARPAVSRPRPGARKAAARPVCPPPVSRAI